MLDRAGPLVDLVNESQLDTTSNKPFSTAVVTRPGDIPHEEPTRGIKVITDRPATFQVLFDVIENRLRIPMTQQDRSMMVSDSKSFLMKASYMHDVFAYLYPCMSGNPHPSMELLACLGMTCTYYMAVNDKNVLPPIGDAKNSIIIYKPKLSKSNLQDFVSFVHASREVVVVAVCGIDICPRKNPTQRPSGHAHVMVVHKHLGFALLIDPNGEKGIKYFQGGPEFLQEVVDALGDNITHPVFIPTQFGPQPSERTKRKRAFGEELMDIDEGGWCVLVSHAIAWLLFKDAHRWTMCSGVKECLDVIHRIILEEFFVLKKMYMYMLDTILPVVRETIMNESITPRKDVVETIRYGASFGIDMNDELLLIPSASKRKFQDALDLSSSSVPKQ